MLWGIWFAGNKMVWEGKELTPKLAMDIGSHMVSDWQGAQQKSSTNGSVRARRCTAKWQLPETHWHKINVDASIREGSFSFQIAQYQCWHGSEE